MCSFSLGIVYLVFNLSTVDFSLITFILKVDENRVKFLYENIEVNLRSDDNFYSVITTHSQSTQPALSGVSYWNSWLDTFYFESRGWCVVFATWISENHASSAVGKWIEDAHCPLLSLRIFDVRRWRLSNSRTTNTAG